MTLAQVDNAKSRVYCSWAMSSNTESKNASANCLSKTARTMTATGRWSTNRCIISLSTILGILREILHENGSLENVRVSVKIKHPDRAALKPAATVLSLLHLDETRSNRASAIFTQI